MIFKLIKKIYYEKYTKKSYSISNVDLVIDRLFSNVKRGVYVDLGCNHPIKYNNTYLLHKRGWNGINIDLDQTSIDEFNSMRKDDHNVVATVSENEGETKDIFYYHKRSTINTLSHDLAEKRNNKHKETLKTKTTTLNNVIENSPYKNTKINLLTIDIENHEYQALKNFNFRKFEIDIIVTECTDMSRSKLEVYTQSLDYIFNTDLYKLLSKNNYRLINWVNSDLIFVNNSFDLK